MTGIDPMTGVAAPECPRASADYQRPGFQTIGHPANATRITILAAYPHAKTKREEQVAYRAWLLRTITEHDFDGGSIRHVTGAWRTPHGNVITEAGVQAEIIVSLQTDPAAINRALELAEVVAIEWDQEEVWVSTEPISLMKVRGR